MFSKKLRCFGYSAHCYNSAGKSMDTRTTVNINVLNITAMDIAIADFTPQAIGAVGPNLDTHQNHTTTIADFTSIQKVRRKWKVADNVCNTKREFLFVFITVLSVFILDASVYKTRWLNDRALILVDFAHLVVGAGPNLNFHQYCQPPTPEDHHLSTHQNHHLPNHQQYLPKSVPPDHHPWPTQVII